MDPNVFLRVSEQSSKLAAFLGSVFGRDGHMLCLGPTARHTGEFNSARILDEVWMFGMRGFASDEPSDAKGAFVMSGVPPGRHELIGRADKYLPAHPTTVET